VLEVLYTCLLIAVALAVTGYSAHVVRKLYRGED
jgi:hypothetical protein